MEKLDNTYPWALAVGAWGDSICAHGNMCRLIEEIQCGKVNVVYFGLDGNVCDFFKAQPNVNKVSWLKIAIPLVINKYMRLASADFKEWMKVTELDTQLPDLIPTHISDHYEIHNPTDCFRDFSVNLPPMIGSWSNLLKDPYILFQPYSVQSCEYAHHWPHWREALEWMMNHTDLKIVMAGELPPKDTEPPHWFPYVEKQVINIVGQTNCMTDLLHIASGAKAIVSTNNALSIWSILKNIPSIICCTKIIKERSKYYYNWINHAPNQLVDWNADLKVFKEQFRSFVD